jgi:hypothetical protein
MCAVNDRNAAIVCCQRGDQERWSRDRNACHSGGGLVVPERRCSVAR